MTTLQSERHVNGSSSVTGLTSKEQFRSLFEKEEPEILKFLDGVIAEFGRDISNLKIYCPVKL